MKKVKNRLRLLIVDAGILLISIGGFTIFKLSGTFAIAICIAGAVVAHILGSNRLKKKELIEIEERRQSLTYQVKKLFKNYPKFNWDIQKVNELITEFERKQKALLKLIELNEGEKGTYLVERSQEAKQFCAQQLVKYEKNLVVLEAIDEDDPEYQMNLQDVENIVKKLKELVNAYSKLLTEVSRMKNGLNLEDPGLTSAVDKLKALRTEDDKEPEGLFLETDFKY